MKVFIPSLALMAAIGLATVSCRNDYEELPQRISPKEATTLKEIDQQRTEFAEILARSMNDLEVRALIKRESAKQFDKDYDILFSLVKDKEVRDGITFEQYLAKYAVSPERLNKLIENLPLLTIYVPELAKFSVNNWEVSTQIPLVAVMNSDHDEKKHTNLKAFDYKGNRFELASNEEPTTPVIVVKENERVVVNNNNNGRLNPESIRGRLLHRGKTNSFYFMDDVFDKEKEDAIKKAGRIANYFATLGSPQTPVDPRVREAWNISAPIHRDYVYYNILSPTGEGTLDYNYAEHITNIQFVNSTAISNANDDQTSDWADGGLEISVDILFFEGAGTLKNTNKMLAIPVNSIKDSNGNPRSFYLPNPVGIGPWDMNTQGNTWQFIIQEWDPIGEYTETVTHTSKFSANFKISGTVIKIGLEGGGTYETTNTKQTTRKVSTTSDQLGKAELYFRQPVITQANYSTSTIRYLMSYNVLDLNTGSVLLTVEPKKLL
jgi:hypothetical protein